MVLSVTCYHDNMSLITALTGTRPWRDSRSVVAVLEGQVVSLASVSPCVCVCVCLCVCVCAHVCVCVCVCVCV